MMSTIASASAVIIRPVQPDDIDLILAMHQRLSFDSIFKRYHSRRVPDRKAINDMCRLNGENGRTEQSQSGRTLIAAISGEERAIIGMAYYVESGQNAAEMAILVEDRYQGQGIGSQLMRRLASQAVAQQIRYFDAYVLLTNQRMIRLLRHSGQLTYGNAADGFCEMRLKL